MDAGEVDIDYEEQDDVEVEPNGGQSDPADAEVEDGDQEIVNREVEHDGEPRARGERESDRLGAEVDAERVKE